MSDETEPDEATEPQHPELELEWELTARDVKNELTQNVASAARDLLGHAATLRGLANSFDHLAALQSSADADTLLETAAGIRAVGMETLATACFALGVCERLQGCARIRGVMAEAIGEAGRAAEG